MPTLEDVCYAVSTELGRPELVVDYAGEDYTPTPTLLRMVKTAHRYLDRFVEQPNEKREVAIAVSQGQYMARLPETLQFIDNVDLETDTKRIPLEHREYTYMRSYYNQPFATVDQAEPIEWSRLTPSDDRERNVLVNGGFDSTVLPWTQTHATLAWDAGTAKLTTTNAIINNASMKYTFASSMDLTDYLLSFDVTDSDPNSSTEQLILQVLLHGDGRDIYRAYGPYSSLTDAYNLNLFDDLPNFTDVVDGTHTLAEAQATLAAVDYIQISVFGVTGAYANFDNFLLVDSKAKIGNLIFMPPADRDYTMYVMGNYYGPALNKNSDVSWWSYYQPDLLITATKRQIAADLNRNMTEVGEYDAQLIPALYEIEKQKGAEDQAGPPDTLRMGWN